MKLRELLSQLQGIQKKIESSTAYICGGTPRDRYLKHLENISDLDITTGDKSVQYLSNEFGTALAKKFNVTLRNHDDGHSTVYIGSFKMDFSSNFNVPGIEEMLLKKGIRHPSDMQKEMYSRDFTCNALLLSLDLKNLVDPTHQGFKDIKDRVIRTCLSPEITLTSNKNRVIRAIYLSSKLDFDIDPSIIEYVTNNPNSVKISTEKVMAEKLNEAFNRNPERAVYNINKMRLWDYIPITQVVQPYYMKAVAQPQKVAYFQGGGGVNEPEPKKKKYKSDPAIVVQPRFKEPFYRNYDIYEIPGFEHIGPGAGWHSMQNYKSVQDFLQARRERLSPRYVADDSWQVDSGKRVKKNPDIQARATLLSRIIKTAGDENDGPNFDYGDGAYTAMSEGKKLKTITDHKRKGPGSFFADDNEDHMLPPKEHGTSIYDWKNSPYQGKPKAPKHDSNDIDFPVDEDFKEGPIHFNEETVQDPRFLGPTDPYGDSPFVPTTINDGDETAYHYTAEIGGDQTYPYPDFAGKMINELDFGRDHSEELSEPDSISDEKLKELTKKYLSPAPTHGLFGLPDGVDLPDEDTGDPNDINPDYGTRGPESLIYEDKWNI